MNNFKPAFDVNNDAYYTLTPIDCINAMFEHTSPDGTLYIPTWPDDESECDDDKYYVLKMEWDKDKLNIITAEYNSLFDSLGRIASVYDTLDNSPENNRKLLSEDDLKVWEKYIHCFEIGKSNYNATENTAKTEVNRAVRLCKLISINAPSILVNNEAKLLAQVMVVNRFAVNRDIVEK